MSGIFCLAMLDGLSPSAEVVRGMLDAIAKRGPDALHSVTAGNVALGHALLATTPEAETERLPLRHAGSGCTITADARIDNRADLFDALHIPSSMAGMGDGELILRAYLEWGEGCLEHLLGDFAFVIHDPRETKLFCARDQIGMRQIAYCHLPGRLLAVGSMPEALFPATGIPPLNESRLADHLAGTEAFDHASTLFEGIHLLPPAHKLVLVDDNLRVERYWSLEPAEELHLGSEAEYAARFMEVFDLAVRCRLRSNGPVAAMLSGGIDSNTVVAVASQQLARSGKDPLIAVSGIGPEGDDCVESRAIRAAAKMPGIDWRHIDHSDLGPLADELARMRQEVEEPFDSEMDMVRGIYRTAHEAGARVMLDGVAGDLVMNPGDVPAYFLSHGRLGSAWRAAGQLSRQTGVERGRFFYLGRGAWNLAVPARVRRIARRARARGGQNPLPSGFVAEPGFAARSGLAMKTTKWVEAGDLDLKRFPWRRVRAVAAPPLARARERYGRAAAAFAIEPRDPFSDLRVIQFCLSVPPPIMLKGGLPKGLLRIAAPDIVLGEIRWRTSKEHLGRLFTERVIDRQAYLPVCLNGKKISRIVQRGKQIGKDDALHNPFDSHAHLRLVELLTWMERF